MSALQRQTYANQDEALFVKTSGNSYIAGNINAQYITARSGFELLDNSSPQTNVMTIACAANNPSGSPIIQVGSGGSIRFGRFGSSAANTYITPAASGTNNDVIVLGGQTYTQKLNLASTSCGVGSIAIGATNVVINTNLVTAGSKIFLSYYGSPSAGPGAGPSQGNLIVNPSLISPGVSFRVDLTDKDGISVAASNVAVTFNWLIIN